MQVFDQYLVDNKLFPSIPDVLTGLLLKIRSVWDITPCRAVKGYQHSIGYVQYVNETDIPSSRTFQHSNILLSHKNQ